MASGLVLVGGTECSPLEGSEFEALHRTSHKYTQTFHIVGALTRLTHTRSGLTFEPCADLRGGSHVTIWQAARTICSCGLCLLVLVFSPVLWEFAGLSLSKLLDHVKFSCLFRSPLSKS